jgi:uncharacterized membrane protein (UPF0127 family)
MWRFASCVLVLTACATTAPEPPAVPPNSIVATTELTSGEPTAPTSSPSSASGLVVPEGFDRVAARVTEPDGNVCEVCLWLAATSEQRQRGLMFVTDLGPADGMAFQFPDPKNGSFWMKNTLLPLSIAFYSPDGDYLDAFDMQPCTADPCPTYPTPDGFLIAVETTQGDLGDIGMVPGSTLALLDVTNCARELSG